MLSAEAVKFGFSCTKVRRSVVLVTASYVAFISFGAKNILSDFRRKSG